jgi:hypothetical protein
VGKAPQSPSLKKLSFVTGVDATRILLTSARPVRIWPFSTSNPKDAKDLKGKGLNPTSTFIWMAPMELVARKTFLRDLAALRPSRSHRIPMSTENMIVKYALTYMFEDFN